MTVSMKTAKLANSKFLKKKNVAQGLAISSLNTKRNAVFKLRPVATIAPPRKITYAFPARRPRSSNTYYRHIGYY